MLVLGYGIPIDPSPGVTVSVTKTAADGTGFLSTAETPAWPIADCRTGESASQAEAADSRSHLPQADVASILFRTMGCVW